MDIEISNCPNSGLKRSFKIDRANALEIGTDEIAIKGSLKYFNAQDIEITDFKKSTVLKCKRTVFLSPTGETAETEVIEEQTVPVDGSVNEVKYFLNIQLGAGKSKNVIGGLVASIVENKDSRGEI